MFYDNKLVRKGSGNFGSEESTVFGNQCPSTTPSISPSTSPSVSSAPSSTPSISLAPSSTPSSAPSLSLCKTSADWTSVLVFYGSTPDCRLPECAGHCNSDSDCDSGLFCYQPRTRGINNSVPGCETVPYDNTNYCVAKELKPSSVPSQSFEPSMLPTIKASAAPSRSPSSQPSMLPTTSSAPSRSPSSQPSVSPTTSSAPSLSPTREPSFPPTLTMVCYFCLSRPSFVRSFVRSLCLLIERESNLYRFLRDCFSL